MYFLSHLLAYRFFSGYFADTFVSANSPNLCPTLSSVIFTNLPFFPLCTLMDCPTQMGKILERRDHTILSGSKGCFNKPACTYGPFHLDLAIVGRYFSFFFELFFSSRRFSQPLILGVATQACHACFLVG
jgi:hypothetical protein